MKLSRAVFVWATVLIGIFFFGGMAFAGDWVTTNPDIYYNEGNVGIGTTSPDSALDVAHSAVDYGSAGVISQRETSGDTIAYGLYNPTQKWDLINIISAPTDYFGIRDVTSGATPFVINVNGNVGIGTTNPGKRL